MGTFEALTIMAMFPVQWGSSGGYMHGHSLRYLSMLVVGVSSMFEERRGSVKDGRCLGFGVLCKGL